MTLEERANKLALTIAQAEAALELLTEEVRAFMREAPGVGPITRKAFTRRCQGIESFVLDLHLDLTPFDPRPGPRDGGGGK